MTKIRILIVDDEEANRVTLEAVLSREPNYHLHFATNGAEALLLAEKIVPDLVLLDVMMPDMDGFAVCRHIRAHPRLSPVPIIMLTALNDQASRLVGINAGADDFISKPYAFAELRARVRTITRLNRFRVIAEQRARFERLFAITPSAIVIVSPDGVISAVNDLAAALLAPLDVSPVENRPLFTGMPADAAARLAEIIAITCRDDTPGPASEFSVSFSECARVFSVKSTRLKENGHVFALLVLHDITAEVRAREELVTLNTRLDALVRDRTAQLETANELLLSYTAFVSHDLRSPLSVIRAYLSMLADGAIPVSAEARSMIKEAFVASGMMEDMIANILTMASDDHHARLPDKAIDPRPILEKLAWKLASFVPKPRPTITVGPLPLIFASAPLVERVFYNLISNAIKYAAKDRAIVIEIGSTTTATGTAIHVRDNGVGFDSAHAEKLFRSFSRLPGSEVCDGMGLGLSLISRLIGAHHGRIWADGRPGEGATFFVEFKENATVVAA
ncbi:sensor histidine kinase [Rariglobus hedericola]|uniref:histidine kinase n=1 Tax=Rariglobus hedericola TaxID=2597822 RepID=A0A556QPN7_9BACT|nr:response regulator [Rariglobus hedericola]TSJ78597.1 response regulator [Rariglobus hedericola]